MVSESSPVAAPKPADKTSDYSPTAEKVYYRIGLGTLIAGGAFLVIGGIAADSDEMGSDAVSDVSFATGGGLLAISSAFWLLYFHENDKKPAATVGVELDKNRAVVQARFAF